MEGDKSLSSPSVYTAASNDINVFIKQIKLKNRHTNSQCIHFFLVYMYKREKRSGGFRCAYRENAGCPKVGPEFRDNRLRRRRRRRRETKAFRQPSAVSSPPPSTDLSFRPRTLIDAQCKSKDKYYYYPLRAKTRKRKVRSDSVAKTKKNPTVTRL